MAPPKRLIKVEKDSDEVGPALKRPKISQGVLSFNNEGKLLVESRSQRLARQPAKSVPSVGTEDEALLSLADIQIPVKRSAISPRNLPQECLVNFRSLFRPAIRDLCATLGPWDSPADPDIICIWNHWFLDHQLEGSEPLSSIVIKLSEDTIRHWRRDMATTAVDHLATILKSSFSQEGDRIARAAWLLGDDEKDRKRPFYYKVYNEDSPPSGIFQSPIIAATLAAHLTSISTLPKEERLTAYPSGALALAILAVKRALTWAETGVVSIPKTPEGHFSRSNWGDNRKAEGGKIVYVKMSSNIVRVISKLQDSQWRKILDAAETFVKPRLLPVMAKVEDASEREDSDFELEDADEDLY